MNGDDIALIIGGAIVVGGAGFFTVKNTMDKNEGIKKLTDAARPVSLAEKFPLALIVTQAAHESNYGRSGLATKSNNLFGIKAGKSWAGQFDEWPTTEVINGTETTVQARFRKYTTWSDSIRDWVSLIKRLYPLAWSAGLKGDSVAFFYYLQKGGYATDPKYAQKLTDVYNSLGALA